MGNAHGLTNRAFDLTMPCVPLFPCLPLKFRGHGRNIDPCMGKLAQLVISLHMINPFVMVTQTLASASSSAIEKIRATNKR